MEALPPKGTYRRLLRSLKPYRATAAAAAVASAIAAAAAGLYAYLIGPLLKAVLTQGPVELGGVAVERKDLVVVFPLAIVAVAALKAVAQWLQGGWMQSAAQRGMADLRRDLHAHLLELPPRFYEERHSGELLSRLTADVAQVEVAVTQALGSYVKDGLQVLALLAVCLLKDVRLFLLTFLVMPAAVVPVSRFARSLKKVATRAQASLGGLSELAAEQLHNLPVVQGYGGETRAVARFDAEQAAYLSTMRRSLFIRAAFTPTVEVLGIVGVALAIGVGARAVAAEPALAENLLSFLAAALLMYQPLKAISGTYSMVAQGLGAAARLFELEDAPRPLDEGESAPVLAPGSALSFDGATVSYDGVRDALRGLTLEVEAGRTVALVGASGSGKSTVFATLLGFVQPRKGRVVWAGRDAAGLSRRSLRERMAWVPQEPILFTGTVRQNLAFGRGEASEAELWDALRRAHADGFVRALPRGLDEAVGERGALLSGGQRQRIAIARAFLRDPSLLLLDEPTSALDAASEREVQAGLAELQKGRTTLVIAHRLSTVRHADLIYVLEAGQVVERGTHDELAARDGRYSALLRQGALGEGPGTGTR
ncbi:MAG TPA: ABC transporter ATP-binding protein [Myxococcaceae bacterium]|nr:ABC transporter ATP-binding protein [Myxococcaceae bacterium]